MATMSGGVVHVVVERANTIAGNKHALTELTSRNEFVDLSQRELSDLFAKLNSDKARELSEDVGSYRPTGHNKKVTECIYGPIPGIPCGSWWGIRMDCSRDRMHDPFSADVHCGPMGAVSICTSHSNTDVDLGDVLTFTGQEAEGLVDCVVGDKEKNQVNRALILNFENRIPVRMVRSYNLSNEYSPNTGYRYDGLYMVSDYWIGVSPENGARSYKFALKRLCHQELPPWESQAPHHTLMPPVLKRYSKNCNVQGQGKIMPRSNPNVIMNNTAVSQCISVKEFRNRNRKTSHSIEPCSSSITPKVVRLVEQQSPRHEEDNRHMETRTTRTPHETMGSMFGSPGRKIVSTDHKNVNVSAIVTRRVSKKLYQNPGHKQPSDSVNKELNLLAGNEWHLRSDEGDEEGHKCQNTRLQNTNISIRTDLYDSSHNLKYRTNKGGIACNAAHASIYKSRIGVPTRQLHLAGVDSSPTSSRTVTSVKMERVTSIDSAKRQDYICREKGELASPNPHNSQQLTGMTDIHPASKLETDIANIAASNSSCNYATSGNCQFVNDTENRESMLEANTNVGSSSDTNTRETGLQMECHRAISYSPTVTTSTSSVNNSNDVNRDLKGLETSKVSDLHDIEHSYGSQFRKSRLRHVEGDKNHYFGNNSTHDTQDTPRTRKRHLNRGEGVDVGKKDRDNTKLSRDHLKPNITISKSHFRDDNCDNVEDCITEPLSVPAAAHCSQRSTPLHTQSIFSVKDKVDVRMPQGNKSESSNRDSIVGSPTSESPFKGFDKRTSSAAQDSWRDSLFLDKMLHIITEEKNSPMAKMLISSVIGLPTTGSLDFSEDGRSCNRSAMSLIGMELGKEYLQDGKTEPRNSGSRTADNSISKSVKTRSCTQARSSLVVSKGNEGTLNLSNNSNEFIKFAKNLDKFDNNPCDITPTPNFGKPNVSPLRQMRCFGNSGEQKVIEIVYTGHEPDIIQEPVDLNHHARPGLKRNINLGASSSTKLKANENALQSVADVKLTKCRHMSMNAVCDTAYTEQRGSGHTSNKRPIGVKQCSDTWRSDTAKSLPAKFTPTELKRDHKSRNKEHTISRKIHRSNFEPYGENNDQRSVLNQFRSILGIDIRQDNCGENDVRMSNAEDTGHSVSERTRNVDESRDDERNEYCTRSRLTIINNDSANSREADNTISWPLNNKKSQQTERTHGSRLVHSTTCTQIGIDPPSVRSTAQIITRSKCLLALTGGRDSSSQISNTKINTNLRSPTKRSVSQRSDHQHGELDQKVPFMPVSIWSTRSTERLQPANNNGDKKVPENIATNIGGTLRTNFLKDSTENSELRRECWKTDETKATSKDKSSEKIRLIKRSRLRVKRKLEIANLFIDMNMSPKSQMSRTISRRSLQAVNYSCRRGCPVTRERTRKRPTNDTAKHTKFKKNISNQTSSVQIPKIATPKKGLSLRMRHKNCASPSISNNNNNNNNNNRRNNNNNAVKRIGKSKQIPTKVKKPMKGTAHNMVVKVNVMSKTIHKRNLTRPTKGMAEFSKRLGLEDAAMGTRSSGSPRNLPVGRLGLRRTLIATAETYVQQNCRKMTTMPKCKKEKPTPAKQSLSERELVDCTLNNSKLDSKLNKGPTDVKKPKMISVMTQCSFIPNTSRNSIALTTTYHARKSNDATDSECVCSSHHSSMEQIKNEIIDLVEIKSEEIDEEMAPCEDDEEPAVERTIVQSNKTLRDSRLSCQARLTLDRSHIGESNHLSQSNEEFRRKSGFVSQTLQGGNTFDIQGSSAQTPKRGFIRYVAGRRTSAFVPVRSVEESLRSAQLKSIGFKPIKPGIFPSDGWRQGSDYTGKSTSDTPRIAYSSAVIKRGVHDEYDKYTSEETNIVQYMDSELCYEDIENEDNLYAAFNGSNLSHAMVQKMEFVKLGADIELEEESRDDSDIQGPDEEEEEEEEMEEELKNVDKEDWHLQISSNSENTEQAFVDSDSEVPWHGWKKIISNKQTYFVGW